MASDLTPPPRPTEEPVCPCGRDLTWELFPMVNGREVWVKSDCDQCHGSR